MRIKLDTFLHGFDSIHTAKLEKLALQEFTISAEELEILSKKLTSVQLTELDLTDSSGFTGSLSALFTHSFPRLDTLKLNDCNLNSNDLQSLARANVEGKLPQLRHLDISFNNDVEISDLFTHSAQWNQLTILSTHDEQVLNIEPELLTSLQEVCLSWSSYQLRPVTRCWSGLRTIELDDEAAITCIADGVERGMFPDLNTVKLQSIIHSIDEVSLFKLYRANIFVHTE